MAGSMRGAWSRLADVLIVATIVLVALVALGALLYHGQRLEQDQLEAHRQLAVLEARHNAHQFGQTLGAVELSLRGLLQAEAGPGAVAEGAAEAMPVRGQRLQELLRHAPHLRSLSLVDRHGLVLASSNPANVGVRVDLRGWLPEPGADAAEEAVLRLGGAYAGRDLADGERLGADAAVGASLGFVPVGLDGGPGRLAAVATLNVDFFLNRLMAREDGAAWAVDVLRWDGVLLLSTREAAAPGWRQADQTLARRWQEGAEAGDEVQGMPGQGRWITAWRSDRARPFVVVARVEQGAALAGAREEARTRALVLMPLIALAALALLLGYRLLRRATLRRLHDQAEQAQQLARLLDALPASVLLFGPDGRALAVNQGWRDMARDAALPADAAEDLHYGALAGLYQPEDGAQGALETSIAAVLAGQDEAFEGTFEMASADGPRWLRIRVRLFLRDGQRCALLVQHDITAARHSAEALRLNSRVFAINAEAIVITDARNRIVSVNPAFTRITGYSEAEVLGRTPAVLSSGQHAPNFYRAMWNRLLDQGSWCGEIVNQRKNGEIFTEWLTITVDRDADGQPRHFVGVFQDITERKRAEARLRLLGAALDAADNAVMITDAQSVIEWANPAFSRLSGHALPELLGRRPQDLLVPGPQWAGRYAQMWRTILGAQVWRGEMSYCRPGGEPYDVACTVTPLAEEDGPPRHFIAVMEDISARKRQEEELHRLATTDALTGVLNRRAFLDLVERELVRFRRHGHPGALLMLDLDHFKLVNDRHGHATGDAVLAQVSATLRERLRRSDRIGRLGGEEFALLLPGTSAQGAQALAESLRCAVAEAEVATASGVVRVTVSIGVATFAAAEPSAATLLGRADRALYQAKARGRDRVVRAEEEAAAE